MKIVSLFSVVRGYNIIMVCIAQYLAAIFVLSHNPWHTILQDLSLLMLVTAGALAIAGGYIINSLYDKDKDLINKPTKTMIDHLVSQNTKITLYFLLNILSVIVASYVSFRAVIFFSAYIFSMWLYSHRIKKILLWGNITSAILSIIPFFAVFVYYRNFQKVIFVHAILIFLLILIKQLVKDLQNIKGDLTHNYATIPVVHGETTAKKLISIGVFTCYLPITLLIYHFKIGNLKYFLLFLIFYLLFFLLMLWKSTSQKQYIHLHTLLKIILVAGVFSVILTR